MTIAEKLACCPSCGADLEPTTGPGRPSIYCSEGCRRLAEFSIRSLVRRVEKYELELRELRVWFDHHDPKWRLARIRNLRRWIPEDGAKLRALLGAKDSSSAAKNAENNRKGRP